MHSRPRGGEAVFILLPVIAGITETITKFLIDVIFWTVRLLLGPLSVLIP